MRRNDDDIVTDRELSDTLGLFVLDDKNRPIRAQNVLEWAKFFDSPRRIVNQTWVDGRHVSTVFLGVNYHGPGGLFETMVFSSEGKDLHQVKHDTWKQAQSYHDEAIEKVREFEE